MIPEVLPDMSVDMDQPHLNASSSSSGKCSLLDGANCSHLIRHSSGPT